MTGDLISRQYAVTLLKLRAHELKGIGGDIGGACSGMAKLIASLPSAEPKTGKWVRKCDELVYWYECSECGERPMANRFSYREERSLFCPSCGARMVIEDGEEE